MARSRRRALALWGAAPLAVGAVVGVVVSTSPPRAPALLPVESTGEPVTDWLAQVADDRAADASATPGSLGAVPSPTVAGADAGGSTSSPAPSSGSASAPGPVATLAPSASRRPATSTRTDVGEPATAPRDVAPPAPVPAVPAAPECLAVASVLHSWPGGYQSEVTVTAGSDALDGWLVTWTVPEGHTVGSSWGAAVTIVDGAASAANASWAAHLDAGRSLTFGVMGSTVAEPVAPTMQCSRVR